MQKGQLLTSAFRFIERCAPFFIGLIGERYGCHRDPTEVCLEIDDIGDDWIDKNLLVAAKSGHDWLLDEHTQCKSFTELQFLYAAFKDCPRRHQLYDDVDLQCFFYYRQPEFKDTYLTHLSADERAPRLRQLEAEDEYCDEQCRRLKGDIIKRGHSVRYYHTLQELGEFVMRDWRMVIDEFCPPIYEALNISNKKGTDIYHTTY